MCQPSTTLELLRSKALTHITDLEALTPPATMDSMTVLQDVTNKYISVHDMVLNQVEIYQAICGTLKCNDYQICENTQITDTMPHTYCHITNQKH